MNSIGIIADDLTSAMEGAGAFWKMGCPSAVTLETKKVHELPNVPCIAIETDSRTASPVEARKRIEAAVKELSDRPILTKTMDSTLRGHIALEIDSALRMSGRPIAIVAPAFPAEGRCTKSGLQYVDGRLVSDTSFRHDPQWPVQTSDICQLLEDIHIDTVGLVKTSEIGSLNNRLQMRYRRTSSSSAWIVDAQEQNDLHRLCATINNPRDVLWVGSPGLLIALASQYGRFLSAPQSPDLSRSHRGPIIVAVGSLNPISRGQLAQLKFMMDAHIVTLDPMTFTKEALDRMSKEEQRLPTAMSADSVLIVTTRNTAVSPDECPVIASALAHAVDRLSSRFGSNRYVLTGGDTALNVLRQLGAFGFELIGELEPGIPEARLIGSNGIVITKAGGFGDPDVLIRACEYLQKQPK
jgi:uncharacterized protein YgbK (DUF1537 family)